MPDGKKHGLMAEGNVAGLESSTTYAKHRPHAMNANASIRRTVILTVLSPKDFPKTGSLRAGTWSP